MDAQIQENMLSKFRPLLVQNVVYYVKYFHVCPARRAYRPVQSRYLAKFTGYTTVCKVDLVPPSFPRYAQAVVSFNEMRSRMGITEFCSG